ncbi:Uncharacterized protein BM_BM1793 [Brugia malayi]|uniref:Bm1793 n=2 Tax=Brugia malayi TaxID=6279 RepID=A0A4E9EVH3_BRUMA|nr:Uncharacterized protein BM_BM1793 [Brugia malayi]VIO88332.1 Uncharacterized protein BM_BM1793 [Brugia malayi]
METGSNKQMEFQLSSLLRSASDMLKLFKRIGTQERDVQNNEQIIRRRQSMQQLSIPRLHEFPSKRKLSLIKSSNLGDMPSVTRGSNHRSNITAENTIWSELLFGPRGVLTAVFHILDDRRKITEKIRDRTTIIKNSYNNKQTTDTYHQSDLSLLPDFLIDAKPIDFAKIFESFLTGSKGNFDERIFNLPEILGICNRLSCGDIYKAIDAFRKSEFFINFQTALQLIQDPKGWEILGDLISNPDLIAQFMNGAGGAKGDRGSIENLFGSITRTSKSSKNNTKEIGPEDGDIGIDFSKMIENGNSGYGNKFEKSKKPTVEELPEIAENIDAIDYYNAVESGADIDDIEKITKPDIIAITETTTIASLIQTKISSIITDLGLILPEISENIDQIEQTKIIIDAITPIPTKISGRQTTVATLQRLVRPYITVTYKPIIARTTTITTDKQTITTRYSTWISTSARRPTTKSTTRNFREDSDYYAMYYDDVRG